MAWPTGSGIPLNAPLNAITLQTAGWQREGETEMELRSLTRDCSE